MPFLNLDRLEEHKTIEILSSILEKLTGKAMSVPAIEAAMKRIIWSAEVDFVNFDKFTQLTRREGFLQKEIDSNTLHATLHNLN